MTAKGPLAGIRVVDLTTVIMGPYATQILGDLGADIIKVESPEGDSLRNYRPLRNEGMAGFFLNLHRNKRSVRLDLKQSEARDALLRLTATADVFVHNMRPQAIAKLGLGRDAVRAQRSDIVYCAAVGFGGNGPYATRAAYDDTIQAASGLAALMGRQCGNPAFVPSVICDKVAGQQVANAILAALLHRAQTGEGQTLEVPMFETLVAFNLVEHIGPYAFEPALDEPGWKRVLSPMRKPFRTKDGFACILPYSDRNWRDFFTFAGLAEAGADPRFSSLAERVQNVNVLYTLVEEIAPLFTNAEWMGFCDRASIPAMPVLDLVDLWIDPHLTAVGMFRVEEHPSEGRYKVVRHPVEFERTPAQLRRHAPRLGEHTQEILAEIGYSAAEVVELTDPNREGAPTSHG
ncbi:crotonobetainyl-CoA:carnitine CoA-transferase CaiB-like acyl-CoA transferase [Bradyrhizobium sp. CIR48]|uniref:CaiB/BaiF CoA transferase family protein n=1 Tax=Bradyrhizobium sp. CIR48 TaxID=2663840 RepID=UPI0016068652|nr:CoA transferase [Bradyrhizobium sp. CIR48]MBB4423829.1 crotonobetainyl-CoA:carnitine CoA-transferase CaiB-like acyl-CoA transferase [Bradyrhizobium sp. CIR48]